MGAGLVERLVEVPALGALHTRRAAGRAGAALEQASGVLDPILEALEASLGDPDAAGVPVVARRYDGMIHGFVSMPMVFPEANDAVARIADAVQESLASR